MARPELEDHKSPAVVTFRITEHFILQTARSAGITELNGRAGSYLATVSSGLIALAFKPAAAPGQLGPPGPASAPGHSI